MTYVIEEFISYCDDMQIADESLRDTNKIYEPNYEKIKTIIAKAKSVRKKEEKIKLLKEAIILIDDTVTQLKALNDDTLDKALSVGSKLVSILIKIDTSRHIMTNTSWNLIKEKSLTTVIPQLTINVLSHELLKKLTIKQKRKLRDKCVKELIDYKIGAKTMLNKLQTNIITESFNEVSIANEAAIDVIRKLKTGLNNLIYKVRKWLQIAYSWLQNKLFKLCKIEYINIDVDYYNSVMGLIDGIKNLGNDPKKYIRILSNNYKVLKSKDKTAIENAINNLQDNYQKIADDLTLLTEEKGKIPSPDKSGKGKTISVAMKDMNAVKNYFEQQLGVGKQLPGIIASIVGGIDESSDDPDTDKLKRLIYSNAFSVSNLIIGKSQTCIRLVNDIIENSKVKTEEDKSVATSTQLAVV